MYKRQRLPASAITFHPRPLAVGVEYPMEAVTVSELACFIEGFGAMDDG
jgi:hypothetical protein